LWGCGAGGFSGVRAVGGEFAFGELHTGRLYGRRARA
jgi:hypothetical protein